MTIYRGPGGTGAASSDMDSTTYQSFLAQTIAAKDAAHASELAAAASAAAALASQIAAAASATAADASATASSVSAYNSSSSATAANASAVSANSAATNASTSASNASASASAAGSSATAAANSAANMSTIKATIPGVLAVFNGNLRWYPRANITISNVFVSINTAPVANSAIFNIRKNGTAVFTGGSKPTVAIGAYTSGSNSCSVPLTPSDYLTIDCEQAAGSDAVIRVDFS